MRIAYFDAGSGVSGDMMLGALVDAGLGADGLRGALSGLDLSGYELEIGEVKRRGLRACRVQVRLAGGDDHEHRHLADILALIERSSLGPTAKSRARDVFCRLGEAEARVHGMDSGEIHLHEVGAVDALVDVVGSVAGLSMLEVDRVVFSPLRLGYGTVHCAHGLLPVPPPAVAELVRGIPVYAGDIEGEMVTPTGAALAVTLADSFGPLPPMSVGSVGLGAGSAERTLPNVLRLFLGEEDAGHGGTAEMVILETNLDDMNPEFYQHLCGRLQEAGAVDAWLTPIQAKKGRPGTLLSVLAEPSDAAELREVIFAESTTLGLRESRIVRHALDRETLTVMVDGQSIAIKLGRRRGRVVQVAPEYEDCRQGALRLGRPLKMVYQQAVAQAWAHLPADANGEPEGSCHEDRGDR